MIKFNPLPSFTSAFNETSKMRTSTAISSNTATGVTAAIELTAVVFGAWPAYFGNTIIKETVDMDVADHAHSAYRHAQFLGPLWQVQGMQSRMNFILNSKIYFHCLYVKI